MEELLLISNHSRGLLFTPTPWLSVEKDEEFVPSAANLAAASLLGLLFVLGTAGNLGVLVLLLRRLAPGNFTHLLMLNLVSTA